MSASLYHDDHNDSRIVGGGGDNDGRRTMPRGRRLTGAAPCPDYFFFSFLRSLARHANLLLSHPPHSFSPVHHPPTPHPRLPSRTQYASPKKKLPIMTPHPPGCPTHHGHAIVATEAQPTYPHHRPILPARPPPPSVDCRVIRPARRRRCVACCPAAPYGHHAARQSCRAFRRPAAPCRCCAASS